MTDQDRRNEAEGVEQPDQIRCQMLEAVDGDRLGLVGLSVAPEVVCDAVEPCSCQCGELVTPRVVQLGKAVDHDDRRTVTLFVDRQGEVADRHRPALWKHLYCFTR